MVGPALDGVTFQLKYWQELGMERVKGTALLAQGVACTEALRQRELGCVQRAERRPQSLEPGAQGGLGEGGKQVSAPRGRGVVGGGSALTVGTKCQRPQSQLGRKQVGPGRRWRAVC